MDRESRLVVKSQHLRRPVHAPSARQLRAITRNRIEVAHKGAMARAYHPKFAPRFAAMPDFYDGPDVSRYQGASAIDSFDLAILNIEDPNVVDKAIWCNDRLIPWDIYKWGFPGQTGGQMFGRAKSLVDALPVGFRLPRYWLDYEEGGVEPWQIGDWYTACDQAGVGGGLYAYKNLIEVQGLRGTPGKGFWVAYYPERNDGSYYPAMSDWARSVGADGHQYTSTNGTLDQNVFFDPAWFTGGAVPGVPTRPGVRFPFDGSYPITSPYGMRYSPTTGLWSMHSGIDFGLPEGTPVLACARGTIYYVATEAAAGNVVDQYLDGPGLPQKAAYFHLSQQIAQVGQHVEPGDLIGLSGQTGAVTGAHLHFAMGNDPNPFAGGAVDPTPYLEAGLGGGTILPNFDNLATNLRAQQGDNAMATAVFMGADVTEVVDDDGNLRHSSRGGFGVWAPKDEVILAGICHPGRQPSIAVHGELLAVYVVHRDGHLMSVTWDPVNGWRDTNAVPFSPPLGS